MEQTILAITMDLGTEPPIALGPEERRRLVDLMAVAIIAVHAANEKDASAEDVDDDARG